MKSNLRNEIKSYIVRQGMTMQEIVDLLRDEHGWSDSVSNLSNIRPDRERSAADRIKAAYGEKYDPVMMHDSKRDVANLLNEETGARSVRNLLRQTQKMQQMQQRREPKRHERER